MLETLTTYFLEEFSLTMKTGVIQEKSFTQKSSAKKWSCWSICLPAIPRSTNTMSSSPRMVMTISVWAASASKRSKNCYTTVKLNGASSSASLTKAFRKEGTHTIRKGRNSKRISAFWHMNWFLSQTGNIQHIKSDLAGR